MPTLAKGQADPIDVYFADVSSRGRIALLKGASGSIRFDVSDKEGVEQWFVTLREGEVAVSDEGDGADAVVRVDRTVLTEIVEGRAIALAAVFRGAITVEGDLQLVLAFGRLFPGRRGSTGRVAPIPEVSQRR
jgi:putative sterol carrier protein